MDATTRTERSCTADRTRPADRRGSLARLFALGAVVAAALTWACSGTDAPAAIASASEPLIGTAYELRGSNANGVGVTSWNNDHLEILKWGTDQKLYRRRYLWGTWYPWQGPLLTSRSLASDPAATSPVPSVMDVYAKSSTGNLIGTRYDDETGTWSPWTDTAGTITSAPAVVTVGGSNYIFARNSSNTLSMYLTSWRVVDGSVTLSTAPSVVSSSPGQIDLVAANASGQIMYKKCTSYTNCYNNVWTSWQYLGYTTQSKIGLASTGIGAMDLFYRCAANNLNWVRYRNGAWIAGETKVGAPDGFVPSSVSAVSTGPGRTDVFFSNAASIWHYTQDDSAPLGTRTTGQLGVDLIPKEEDNWCWAGSIDMVSRYMGLEISQCSQVNFLYPRPPLDCCVEPAKSSPQCNLGGWDWLHYDSLFTHFGYNSPSFMWDMPCDLDPPMLSVATMKNQLVEKGKPFFIDYVWADACSPAGSHDLVAADYLRFGEDDWVLINDPDPTNVGRQQLVTYSYMKGGSAYDHYLNGVIRDITPHPTQGYVYVAQSIETRFGAQRVRQTWACERPDQTCLPGDVNGDKKADIIVADSSTQYLWNLNSTGTGFGGYIGYHSGISCVSPYFCDVGNVDAVNGDDVLQISLSGSNPTAWVFLSNGNGYGPPYGGVLFSNSMLCSAGYSCVIGDVNGDGKADVISVHRSTQTIRVKLSTGTSFSASYYAGSAAPIPATAVLKAANVNGDGWVDLVGFDQANARVHVCLSNGSSFGTCTQWHGSFAPAGQTPLVGDFNGDGRTDVLSLARGWSGYVYGAYAEFDHFIGTNWLLGRDIGPGTDVVLTGDFDGDGRTDIFAYERDY